MEIKRVWAVYWSATGTTKKTVLKIAAKVAELLNIEKEEYDFTLPNKRETVPKFTETDLVVFGVPTYAGRVPNLLLKYITQMKGDNTLAIPIVLFGNRAFDNSLIELRDILHKNGFIPFAAAAFVGEHSFSETLGAGRPNSDDLLEAATFAEKATEKIKANDTSLIKVDGLPEEERGYYQPKTDEGEKIDIRKVKPKTSDACDNCGICAAVCPMGTISKENFREIEGICIKCSACVKKCPQKAKYFDDEGFLYHKIDLEKKYQRKAENTIYI